MPFIPHTEEEIRDMLSVIGADSIEQLFDEIPDHLRIKKLDGVPASIDRKSTRLNSSHITISYAVFCLKKKKKEKEKRKRKRKKKKND